MDSVSQRGEPPGTRRATRIPSDSEGVPYYFVHGSIGWREMPEEFGIEMTFERAEDGVGCAWRLEK